MKKIIVVGHKNPDTDSIVATIVWADFLNKKKMPAKAARAGEINAETKFALDKFKVAAPELVKNLAGEQVFLIDHGELTQSAEGIEKADVIGVLDHHNMGGIRTVKQIHYRSEPLGSTSALVAKIFGENGWKLNKIQASLLLAGIISDTLKFTSPTATIDDKKIAAILQKISRLDINDLAAAMFEAKSSLQGLSLGEILEKDYKEFVFGGRKIGIGVYETVRPAAFDEKIGGIFAGLKKLKAKQGVECLFFAVIDILKQEAFIYLIGEQEIAAARQVFKGKIENNIMRVAGLVSRKKQMVPVLDGYFSK